MKLQSRQNQRQQVLVGCERERGTASIQMATQGSLGLVLAALEKFQSPPSASASPHEGVVHPPTMRKTAKNTGGGEEGS